MEDLDTELRRRLLDEVRGRGAATSTPVAQALLTVPRHVFVPEVGLEAAYRDQAIVTMRDGAGVPISSSSQPTIMAFMLDQLDVAPGHRVLEIGTGTGYNAALLAHLVGPSGAVVSIDIDPAAVRRARTSLAAAGYPDVTVVHADAAPGHAAGAPYDRIIATVGVWDLAPAWLEQLAPDGRIVVPLDLNGAQVSAAFARDRATWVSLSLVSCGFMRLRGELAGPGQVRMVEQEPRLALLLPDNRELDVDAVSAALAGPPVVVPTGVVGGGGDPFSDLGLWLAITQPRYCQLVDEDRGSAALARAPVQQPGFRATAGIIDGASLAMLARRPVGPGAYEVEAHGYGPAGATHAARLAADVHAWDAAGRPDARRLAVTAHPSGTPVPAGGIVIDKVHTRLVVTVSPPPA